MAAPPPPPAVRSDPFTFFRLPLLRGSGIVLSGAPPTRSPGLRHPREGTRRHAHALPPVTRAGRREAAGGTGRRRPKAAEEAPRRGGRPIEPADSFLSVLGDQERGSHGEEGEEAAAAALAGKTHRTLPRRRAHADVHVCTRVDPCKRA